MDILQTAVRLSWGATLETLVGATGVLATALPQDSRLAWRELANKLEAFEAFQRAEDKLGLSGAPLADRLRRAREHDPYTSVWLLEGVGHAYADAVWQAAGGWPSGALTGREALGVPAQALLPLHTGLGMAFAARLLPHLDGASPDEARTILRRFLALCADNALPGWEGAVCEALGLAARQLSPFRVAAIARQAAEESPELAALVWHGVGRGLYFAPSRVFPSRSSRRQALEEALGAPPDAAGRRNALSGLAWAMTLVSFRHPEVVAGFLCDHGHLVPEDGAFGEGVAGAVRVWLQIVGREALLTAFLGFRPEGASSLRLWERHVRQPGAGALARPAAAERPGDLFRLPEVRP